MSGNVGGRGVGRVARGAAALVVALTLAGGWAPAPVPAAASAQDDGCAPPDGDEEAKRLPPVAARQDDAGGGAWTDAAPVAPEAGRYQVEPAAVSSPGAGPVAVWLDLDATFGEGSEDVLPLVWSRQGEDGAWSPAAPVHPGAATDGERRRPVLAALADGTTAAAWDRAGEGGERRRTFYSLLPPGADGWTDPEPLGEVESAADLVLAGGPDGALYAAWTGSSDLGEEGGTTPLLSVRGPDGAWSDPSAARTIPGRAVVSDEVEACGDGDPATLVTGGDRPALAVRPDGAAVLTWRDDEATIDDEAARSERLEGLYGGVWGPATGEWSESAPVLAEPITEDGRDALAVAGETVHLVTQDGFDLGLRWATLAGDEGAWQERGPLPTPAGEERAFDPTLAVAGDGTLLLAWRSFAGGGRDRVAAALLPPDAEEWTLLPAIEAESSVFGQAAAFDAAGRPVALWREDGADESRLRFATFEGAGAAEARTARGDPVLPDPNAAPADREGVPAGNPGGSGTMPGPGPADEPAERWRFTPRAPIGFPVVASGRVFLLVFGDEADVLVALDAATGEEVWSLAAPDLAGGPVVTAEGRVVAAIVVGDGPGAVVALDPETGDAVWQAETPWPPGPLALAGGAVVVGSGGDGEGGLVAFDAATGDARWEAEAAGDPVALVASADLVGYAVSGEEDSFVALDAGTGEERWVFAPDSTSFASAATDGDLVVVNDGAALTALDAESGEERWSAEGDFDLFGDVTLADGAIYAHLAGGLGAYDAGDGSERWVVELAGELQAPAVADGVVYQAAGLDGGGVLSALDAADGEERWRVETEERFTLGRPVVVGGAVYTILGADTLVAYGEETG